MVESKAWDWSRADKNMWIDPCEESYYLAAKWKSAGVRTILDIGCGMGRHSVFFAKQGFEVSSVDLSEEGVAHTKAWAECENLHINCRIADMNALPFPDGAFDAVFSYHVLSHTDTEGIKNIISELTRVMKPDEKIFLTMCSKEHEAFHAAGSVKVDDNTVMKTEGAEINVPHFFVDDGMIPSLFDGCTIEKVRHTRECVLTKPAAQHKCHYYIEAKKNQ